MTLLFPSADSVEQYRGRLFGIAYRMLGQVQEAEDLVQETYLRWHQTDQAVVQAPLAWLVAVVTRLSIDRLRRAAVERTTYVGEWLPEPLAAGAHWAADHRLAMQSDLSMAFLVLLERLAPEERAAFLLREVFDEDYAAIAEILDKTEATVRQIVHRARQRVRTDRSRVRIDPDAQRRLLRRFLAAVAENDKDAVLAMVAPDATFTSDGGGKAQAAINVLVGSGRVASMFLGIEAKWPLRHGEVDINGEPGILSYAGDRLIAATAFEIVDGRILNVYRVMNPDKVRFAAPPGPG